MYKTDTKNEAKILRAIYKMWGKVQFDSTPEFMSYFGCTNIKFAYYTMYIVRIATFFEKVYKYITQKLVNSSFLN